MINFIDATGRTRDDVAVSAVDQTVTLKLLDDLPRGTQVVSYRIVSADGHLVAGSLMFSIGAAMAAATVPVGGNSVAVLIWLTDWRLSWHVRWHRRRILRGLDRAGRQRREAHRWRALDWSCQRGGLARFAGPRRAGSSAVGHREAGALESGARHQPWAVAVDCDRCDGAGVVCGAKRDHDDRVGADFARDGRRWLDTGRERSRRHRPSTMADPVIAVSSRNWRGLLGRCACAIGSNGAAAQGYATAGAPPLLERGDADRRVYWR
ncbi:MAG: copper resistance protein CopC [Bradyrhizobium sp.]|nr:copper resistance protein CopC [Bradyrhizobium sp.]